MFTRRATGVSLLAFVLSAAMAGARPAAAQTYKVLYPFRASVRITSSLVEVAPGEFYGTTDRGGAWSQGSVVKVTTAGVVTTLHSFSSNVDGESPVAGLVYDGADDFLYGTTTSGGPNGRGTIFRISPDGTLFETVYSFDGSVVTDPFSPEAALVKGSDGRFYGTSRLGGANGLGTVFSLDVSTMPATLTTLYSFSGGATDGAGPVASLLESGGFLYGTTLEGGEAPNPGGSPIPLGTVFRISLSGSMDWVKPFGSAVNYGRSPRGGVVEKGGVFYGTTEVGGPTGDGTVFKVTDAGVLTKVYDFGSNGRLPRAGLTLGADGFLYGTTNNGGANFLGTVFRLDPSATPVVDDTRHSFNGTDGAAPTTGLVLGSDGRLFGTTSEGGPGGYGTAYWVNPTFPTSGVFYADPGTEGAGPFSPLYRDGGGVLYGTASVGGKSVGGAIYRLDPCAVPPCVLTTLRATQDLGMGQDFSGVVPGPGGFLYGTAWDSNSVYKIDTLNGSGFQKLYTFTGSPGNFPNGSSPVGVMERGGILYGATASGGASDKGTLFALDPASPANLAWSTAFSGTDGRYPTSQLVAGSDGKLYGVTSVGGASDKGTLFRVTTAGTHELLHSFSGPDGSNPWAALTPAGPVIFYGTTAYGGVNGVGTFFRLDATTTPATVQTLRDFAPGEVEAVSVLTLGSDGNFYGTSYGWGAYRLGSVIQLAPSGALRILYSFSGTDGAYPRGGVLRLADGTLLGTAEMAGPNDGGVVFQLNPATSAATAVVSGGGTTCAGGTVTLTATLTGTPPWSLTWSDGFVQSVSASPATRVVTASASTIYTLTVLSDAFGEGTVSGSAPITVSGVAPSAAITAPLSASAGATGLTASVPAAGGGATYLWTVTNGSLTSGQGTNSIVYAVGPGGFTGLSVTIAVGTCSVTGYAATAVGAVPAGALTFTHFAGTVGGPGAVDGPAAAARIAVNVNGIVSDATGTLHIADGNNLTVRRISPSGDVTTLAGLARAAGTADGPGSAARFGRLWGVARNASGELYVTDLANYTLRKVTPGGVVTTVAGVAGSPGSQNGPPGVARFTQPTAVAVDGSGNVYVADGRTVRMVTPSGDVSTLAGDAAVYGDDNGIGTAAHFGTANGLALDGAGFLYVSDLSFHTIRRIDLTTKEVTTLAGVSGSPGSNNGTGTAARFANPRSLVYDGAGHLFLADQSNSTIRRIDLSTKEVTTFVGVPGAYGSADGDAATARFSSPSGLAIDGSGNLYVTEPLTAFGPAALGSTRVRRITTAGVVSTVASVPNERGGADGAGPAARFFWPKGLAADPAGNVYVTEFENHTLRKIAPGGSVATLAGLAGVPGSDNGPLGTSRLAHPDGVAVDASGNVYVADSGNHTIRKITPGGSASTFAGASGTPGSDDGTGGAARFDGPRGVAVDANGFVYVADTGNNTIRKITPGGSVSTLAGAAGFPGTDDGTGSAARFLSPLSLAVDAAGNLFVATSGKVRKVTAGGTVTTLNEFGSLGINAVALDVSGNLYAAATTPNTIVKRTPAGVVTTLVPGQSQMEGSEDGTDGVARFFNPSGLAVDAAGSLFVADMLNHSIRAGRPALSVAATIDSATGAVGAARQLGTSSAATTYAWDVIRRPSGSTATLSSASSRTPTFTPDIADLFVFRLTASNGTNTSITLVSLAASPSGCTPPSAAITAPAAVEARTTSHTASVPDAGAGATYAWTIANGTFTSPDNTATVTWTAGSAGITTLTATVTSATSCVASSNKQVRVRTRADATGDGKADPVLFRPSTGQWRVRQPGGTETLQTWGQAGDVPVPGDYDGDGKTDLAVFRPSDDTWWIIWSSNGSFHGGTWGAAGDVPVPGDYDGDGKTDLAVFRPSTGQWWVIPSGGGAPFVLGPWGTAGDVAVPADYDGDGRTDLAVYRPAGSTLNPGPDAQWWLIPSGGGPAGVLGWWGAAGDIPVPADYDGDGKADFATFRPSDGDWWVRQSSDGQTQARLYGRHWGQSGDVPVPADYDGDGKADWVVYRPGEARWYLLLSGTVPPGDSFLQGAAGDIPVVTAP